MQIAQVILRQSDSLPELLAPLLAIKPQLLLVFGSAPLMQSLGPDLPAHFPQTICVGCSTAGEISSQGIGDASCVLTALNFDSTQLIEARTRLLNMADSQAAGCRLGAQLPAPGLRAVLLFGQGVAVNGSAMIQGLAEQLEPGVPITGGLAADAAAFKQTWVLSKDGVSTDGLVCVGLYGQALNFCHGTFGGWTPFGPARQVTRSDHNVLYELDGEPALDIYKRYLGDYAKDLPASGLLFPFDMLGHDHNEVGLIRTILAVDEAQGSLTLAGDIEPDGYLRLMHASTDALVDGAEAAAQAAQQMLAGQARGQSLVLLVSCVGRKLVMGGRVDEEVEAVAAVFGQSAVLAGFYSNGEISPLIQGLDCKLHNQTMTISTLSEN